MYVEIPLDIQDCTRKRYTYQGHNLRTRLIRHGDLSGCRAEGIGVDGVGLLKLGACGKDEERVGRLTRVGDVDDEVPALLRCVRDRERERGDGVQERQE